MFDDVFNDSFFQGFFGGTTEKQITVASDPDALKVLALPAEGRPAGFSGAVGKFDINSEFSSARTAAGDPLTLRLKVTGMGNFDRVNSAMLGRWTAGRPTSQPRVRAGRQRRLQRRKEFRTGRHSDEAGPANRAHAGVQLFHPETRRYETKRTAPVERGSVKCSRWQPGHDRCPRF